MNGNDEIQKLVIALGNTTTSGGAAASLRKIARNGRANEVSKELANSIGGSSEARAVQAMILLGAIATYVDAKAVAGSGAVKELVKRLHRKEQNRDLVTISTLGAIVGAGEVRTVVETGALPALINTLEKGSVEIQNEVFYTIGSIAEGGLLDDVVAAGAVPVIVRVFRKGKREIYGNATWTLGIIAKAGGYKAVIDAGGLEIIVRALRLKDEDVRREAAVALKSIVSSGDTMGYFTQSMMNELFLSLQEKDDSIRQKVVEILGDIGNPKAISQLEIFMKREKNEEVIEEAQISIEKLKRGQKRFMDLLGIVTPDDITTMEMTQDIPGLLRVLKSRNVKAHHSAIVAIMRIYTQPFELNNFDVQTSDPQTFFSRIWGRYSKEIVQAKGIPIFLKMLSNKDDHIREISGRILEYVIRSGYAKEVLDANGVPLIIHSHRDSDRGVHSSVVSILNGLVEGGWVKNVVKSGGTACCMKDLADEEETTRLLALRSLWVIIHSEGMEPLDEAGGIEQITPLLKDSNREVRTTAAGILIKALKSGEVLTIAQYDAIPQLIAVLDQNEKTLLDERGISPPATKDTEGKLPATSILKDIIIDELIKQLDSDDPKARKTAVKFLGQLGDKRVVKPFTLLGDTEKNRSVIRALDESILNLEERQVILKGVLVTSEEKELAMMGEENIFGVNFNDIKEGDSASQSMSLSDRDVSLFATITGDFNPLHMNGELA